MIDLRSDTVTRPSTAMRKAMAEAEVGDDVYREDPTVLALEREVADVVGKEAALFVSSGTMGNQLAIACQTRPGDEVIIGEGAHIGLFELGAASALNGVQLVVVGKGGLFTAPEVAERLKSATDHHSRTALVSLENTHNRAGGRVFPQRDAVPIAESARSRGAAVHLDGARLWNACVATGLSARELAEPFDTVSVCFSKGLGAPVGSALVGSKAVVEAARRFRKMWGGGTRQAGILAAAALFALRHNRERLVEDHESARAMAASLAGAGGLKVDAAGVETNIVVIEVDGPLNTDEVAKAAREAGVALNVTGPRRLRAVTHMDVSREEVVEAARVLARVVGELGELRRTSPKGD